MTRNLSPPDHSAAELWAPLARFVAIEARWADRAARGRATAVIYEFLRFGVKQAWACLFGGAMLALLTASYFWYPVAAVLPRYDFLVLAALAIQVALLAFRMETWEEAKVIFLFHVVGTLMEVFKTGVGSWVYPEPNYLRIGGVPLFTGFMYAAVGSYMARAWRLFDFRFSRHPPRWQVMTLAVAIYANFFLDHWRIDLRIGLFAVAALIFWPTFIHYRIWRLYRSMPLLVACGLAALFVWIAENVGTFARAWVYPYQVHAWAFVGFGKFSSWFLLLIISYAIVAAVHGTSEEKPVDPMPGLNS